MTSMEVEPKADAGGKDLENTTLMSAQNAGSAAKF
jgi:hypothetical protein